MHTTPANTEYDVIIVGGGAAGLVAALAAAKRHARVLLLEKGLLHNDVSAEMNFESNTSRSTGLIPAAGTKSQRDAGVLDDTPQMLAQDILASNGGKDASLVNQLAAAATITVDWLTELLPTGTLVCANDFLYPGHSRLRMHGPQSGYGRRLHKELIAAVQSESGINLQYGVDVAGLFTAHSAGYSRNVVKGVQLASGTILQASAVILATNGFGANKAMVAQHLGSGVVDGLYLGSPLNTGDGIKWAVDIGADTKHMSAYQGHASVASPDGPLVTWGVIVTGGILVNLNGERFGNELVGYSTFSEKVLALPGAEAVEIFPHGSFEACRGTRLEEVIEAGKVEIFKNTEDVCKRFGMPLQALNATLGDVRASVGRKDKFGRVWPVESPWTSSREPLYAILVRAALFHTQGGLSANSSGQVLHRDGLPIPGLYAAGGVAAGVSGDGAAGYLSGNGLLHSVVMGRLAGEAAAAALTASTPAAL